MVDFSLLLINSLMLLVQSIFSHYFNTHVTIYELAGEMNDLDLGSAHLVPVITGERSIYVVNIVVMKVSKSSVRQLSLKDLKIALDKVAIQAKKMNGKNREIQFLIKF